jgi:hypothetical protein
MVTYNLAVITKEIYDSGLLFFTSGILKAVLEVKLHACVPKRTPACRHGLMGHPDISSGWCMGKSIK